MQAAEHQNVLLRSLKGALYCPLSTAVVDPGGLTPSTPGFKYPMKMNNESQWDQIISFLWDI